jgi:hypothetical protein
MAAHAVNIITVRAFNWWHKACNERLKENQMNHVLMLTALLLMSGCALNSGATLGPDGKRVTFIEGMSTSVAYDKANKACPNGYAIVEEPRETAFIDYEMTVECK